MILLIMGWVLSLIVLTKLSADKFHDHIVLITYAAFWVDSNWLLRVI
jgi:hypothetical protein